MAGKREGRGIGGVGRGGLGAGVLALCALLAPSAGGVRAAERVEIEGVSVPLPAGWSAAPEGLEGVWVRKGGTANVNIAAMDTYSEVSRGRLRLARAEVERAVASALDDGDELRIHEFQFTQMCGVPAYRVECQLQLRGARVRQLQYVLSGEKLLIVTFSAPAETYGALRGEFERIAAGIDVRRRAGTLRRMPAWFCGWVLAALVLLAAAGRWARHRLEGTEGAACQGLRGALSVAAAPVTFERGISNKRGV